MYNLAEIFRYLDKLRESGIINMLGAGAYLERDCGLSPSDARVVLGQWIDTFSDETLPEERANAFLNKE